MQKISFGDYGGHRRIYRGLYGKDKDEDQVMPVIFIPILQEKLFGGMAFINEGVSR